MLHYIASLKINNKPLKDTKYDFSIIVEKIENWIGRTVHGLLRGKSLIASVFPSQVQEKEEALACFSLRVHRFF